MILGIDYGRRKIGIAFAEGSLAQPLRVIKVESFDDAVEKIGVLIKKENPGKIVVGVSEGEMGKESEKFAKKIGAITFDETLTSQYAQILSREAGVPQKKRREMEDAYAAAIMLQNYLDSQ